MILSRYRPTPSLTVPHRPTSSHPVLHHPSPSFNVNNHPSLFITVFPKNPFLQVYLLRPSKCQEPAGPCKTLVKAGSSKFDLRDLASTCKFILLENLLTSTCKIPQVTLTRSCQILLKQASCKELQVPDTCQVLASTLARMDSWV